jgi:selenocysteine lyase/cysteine desulfurase
VASGSLDGAVSALPDRCRHRFRIFDEHIYANSCSQGALSDSVRKASEQYLDDWDALGSPWDLWVAKEQEVRALFALFVGGHPDEVAVVPSVSAAVSSLASGIDFGARSRVVTTDLEFPTVGQIWHAQERRGVSVVHIAPGPDGLIPLERLEAAIGDDTAVVSVTHVSYRTGARLDISAVADLAHRCGALVLVDGYQSAGTLPIDVQQLGIDALVTGMTKYLLGSSGIAFLWCRRDLVPKITPTVTGWLADADPFEMDAWDYSPAGTARRFQGGTPAVSALYSGRAGLDLIAGLGVQAIEAHVSQLSAQLVAGVEDLGAKVVTPAFRGSLICVKSLDAAELVTSLNADRVITSTRDGNLRISLHAYNTSEDVELILEALAKHRQLLA